MIVYKLSKNVKNTKYLIKNKISLLCLYFSLLLDRKLIEGFPEPHN